MNPNLSTAFFKFFYFFQKTFLFRLPARNCRQQRESEEDTEIRKIEHKSAEILRSEPETDIVGHVPLLMPVIPVRHASADRKRKPELFRPALSFAFQSAETCPQPGQQKEGESFHLLRAVREAAARYTAVMAFPQDNMSLADRNLLIFL